MGPLAVLIADDRSYYRVTLIDALKKLRRKLNIYEAGNAEEVIRICGVQKLDLALIDLCLNDDLPSYSLIKNIRQMQPNLPILVVSVHDEGIFAERTLRAGASGYLMKDHVAQSLVTAAKHILAGNSWVSDQLKDLKNLADRRNSGVGALTHREYEVFILLGRGLKKAVITKRLKISGNTFEEHRRRIKSKLGASSAEELYLLARAHFKE